jgi:hypothetical protein
MARQSDFLRATAARDPKTLTPARSAFYPRSRARARARAKFAKLRFTSLAKVGIARNNRTARYAIAISRGGVRYRCFIRGRARRVLALLPRM